MPDSAPEWVESQGKPINGLDLTGLRLPVDAISTYQLIGLTTVTPRIRFLSIRAWVIKAFSESGLPNSLDAFNDFALRVETAIVLSILLNNRTLPYLPGITKALATIDEGHDKILLERLVDQPGYNLYAGTSYNLLLGHNQDNAPPLISEERGMPLAKAFERLIASTNFFKTLKKDSDISIVSREDLKELGLAIDMGEISEGERTCLLASLMPSEPAEKFKYRETRRVGAYTLFLELANYYRRQPKEEDVFEAALAIENHLPKELTSVLDGYLCYRIRDALAVTHEAVLGLVCRELGGHEGAVHHDRIIQIMLTHSGCNTALRNLGLLTADESIFNVNFQTLSERVLAKLENKQIGRGLVRWEGELNENALIESILQNRDLAAGLMPVVWLLCRYRVAVVEPDGFPHLGMLFQTGAGRFGLREVVFPQLEAWVTENPSVAEVIAWLIQRTVDQHLRIAWSRMFADMNKDVAILLCDSDSWQHRGKSYEGGRMASRITDAIGWLRQLRLLNNEGLTDKGKEVLQHGYGVLTRFGGDA